MTESSLIGASRGTSQMARRSRLARASSPFGPRVIAVVMDTVRKAFVAPKVAEQLAAYLRCDVSTARRFLSGRRVPDGPQILTLLEHPVVGPQTLITIVEHLPLERQAEMLKAVKGALDIIHDNEEIERARAILARAEAKRKRD